MMSSDWPCQPDQVPHNQNKVFILGMNVYFDLNQSAKWLNPSDAATVWTSWWVLGKSHRKANNHMWHHFPSFQPRCNIDGMLTQIGQIILLVKNGRSGNMMKDMMCFCLINNHYTWLFIRNISWSPPVSYSVWSPHWATVRLSFGAFSDTKSPVDWRDWHVTVWWSDLDSASGQHFGSDWIPSFETSTCSSRVHMLSYSSDVISYYMSKPVLKKIKKDFSRKNV